MVSWLQLAALLVAACAVSGATAEACHAACACEGTSMLCVNAQLTAPPEGDWPSFTYLALDGNNITELHEDAFKGFPSITKLTITNNQLTTFDPTPFRVASKLTSLDVSGNHIKDIVEVWYGVGWKELYLNDNEITELDPPDILHWVVAYRGLLELKNNPLKAKPGKSLIYASNPATLVLDGIDASEFNSKSLQMSFSNPTSLSLKNAGIRDITGVFTEMSHLDTLWLSGNDITHVTAGSFFPGYSSWGGEIRALYLNENPLQRLDVAAVSEAMPLKSGNLLDISDTPLACDCAYEALYWWAEGRQAVLTANCQGRNLCQFDA